MPQEEFCTLLAKWWQEYILDPTNIASSWVKKLSFLRRKIREWARNYYGKKKKDKQLILDRLNALDIIQESRTFTPVELKEWNTLRTQLEDIYLDEELYWKHRANQTWLEAGDQNTKYFHLITNHRKKKNKINSLEIDNITTTSPTEIKQHVFDSYKNILGIPGFKYASLEPNFWEESDKITPQENSLLVAPFTLEEIRVALFACEANGAPGPDDLSFKFYQHFWDIVKTDLLSICSHFHTQTLHLDKLNKSVMSHSQRIQCFNYEQI